MEGSKPAHPGVTAGWRVMVREHVCIGMGHGLFSYCRMMWMFHETTGKYVHSILYLYMCVTMSYTYHV